MEALARVVVLRGLRLGQPSLEKNLERRGMNCTFQRRGPQAVCGKERLCCVAVVLPGWCCCAAVEEGRHGLGWRGVGWGG